MEHLGLDDSELVTTRTSGARSLLWTQTRTKKLHSYVRLAPCVELCLRFSDDRRQKRLWHHLDRINKRWRESTSCSYETGNPRRDAALEKLGRKLRTQTGYPCWHWVGQVTVDHKHTHTRTRTHTHRSQPWCKNKQFRQQWQPHTDKAAPTCGGTHKGSSPGTTMLHKKKVRKRKMPSGMT